MACARLPLAALAAGLAIAVAASLAWPERYAATARVMLPPGVQQGSRIVKLEQAAGDPQALRQLCTQLLEHWFTGERQLLAIVSAQPREGRSRLAAQLAAAFAATGAKTLLIDGGFRAPALHRAFNLPNAHGLADLLEDRRVSLASAGTNLSVMVAGTARGPDFQMFAALAGGALVVTAQESANAHSLRGLHAALQRCAARLVATVARRD